MTDEPLVQSNAEKLMIYRIEEAVKERVSKWATKQFAVVVALANLIVFLGIGTVGYSVMKSALDGAVEKGVDDKIANAKGEIETAVKSYQNLVDKALSDLNDKRGEIEQLRMRLKEATADAENTTTAVQKMSQNSQQEYAKFKKSLDESNAQMRNASKAIKNKYDLLQENYRNWGKDVYQRSSIAIDILGAHLGELRALRTIAEGGLQASDFQSALQREQSLLSENSKTLVILYVQSGIDRNKIDEAKWQLGLQLRGFLVSVVYSGSTDYSESKTFLQGDTSGLEDTAVIADQCVIVPLADDAGNSYGNRIEQEFSDLGIPTDCFRQEKWSISEKIKSVIDVGYLTNSQNIVFAYFLQRPSQ